ncbi:Regulator of ribonuclease activity B [Andreprevotia lacus DSM 23236]|jgi:hypothetical protein|uniref:Regulator of ribonuclease activity B n=1 Tax=Andreprevotia lacus DSM 23236 TaxID=1121001 RepID=A0A1W1XYW3_9NEIS|nr:ribonuclease E inhibitor RraB [Andreprevotia lacus]SMC29106.1 Regulator of ribonuclease activity B [Andreprevotia lacus DSM 23236]
MSQNVDPTRNADLWAVWLKLGLDSSQPFAVDFRFYAVNQRDAERLEARLRELGAAVEKKSERTLIIFKGWVVKATLHRLWTLAELDAQCLSYTALATEHELRFEGCGALVQPVAAV